MLYRNIDDLLLYAQIAVNVDFTAISSTIKHIENNVLVKIIGQDLFDELETKVAANNLNTYYTKLLDLCCLVTGPLITRSYAVSASVLVSDSGAQRLESDSNKTAYAYQVTNAREEWMSQADVATENLLAFLQKNVEKFEKYTASDEYKYYDKFLIKTASDFCQQYTTPQPHRFFAAVKFKMEDVELLQIKKAIPAEYFTNLKAKTEPNEYEQTLIKLIKKAISYLTVAQAVPYLNIRFDDNGITVVSDYGTADTRDTQSRKAAEDSRVSLLMKQAESDGTTFLTEAIAYMKNNVEQLEGLSLTTTVAKKKVDYGNSYNTGIIGL